MATLPFEIIINVFLLAGIVGAGLAFALFAVIGTIKVAVIEHEYVKKG